MGLLDLFAEDYTPRYRNNHRAPEGSRLVVRLRPMTAEQGERWHAAQSASLEALGAGDVPRARAATAEALMELVPAVVVSMSQPGEVSDLVALPQLCVELLNRSISGPEPVHTGADLLKGAKIREEQEAGSGLAWLADQLADALERAEGNG